jgi:hypothetical protein
VPEVPLANNVILGNLFSMIFPYAIFVTVHYFHWFWMTLDDELDDSNGEFMAHRSTDLWSGKIWQATSPSYYIIFKYGVYIYIYYTVI